MFLVAHPQIGGLYDGHGGVRSEGNRELSLGFGQERTRGPDAAEAIKLVYIAHSWHLGTTSEPLINEHPEAWEYGPVIPSLYHEFKIFGNKPITKKATDFVPQDEEQWMLEEREVDPPSRKKDAKVCEFLDSIWKRYRNLSGSQLSTLTHQPGTPWETTWNERGKYQKGVDIPESRIREHYRNLKTQKHSLRG